MPSPIPFGGHRRGNLKGQEQRHWISIAVARPESFRSQMVAADENLIRWAALTAKREYAQPEGRNCC
jgi:hypothetical protein